MKTTKLTNNQLAVMAAILGVSNSGSDHLFHGTHPEFTPADLVKYYSDRALVTVEATTNFLVAGLCETEEMLDMFQEEAKSWVKTLRKMPVDEIKSTWKRYAPFVDAITQEVCKPLQDHMNKSFGRRV